MQVKNFLLSFTKYTYLDLSDVVGNLIEFEYSHLAATHEKYTKEHDSYSGDIVPPSKMLIPFWIIMHEKEALFVEMADEKVVHHG